MADIMLVIGSVTAKQYTPVRLELMEAGLKPEVVRIDPSKFDFGDYYVAQSEAGEDQLADPAIRGKVDQIEELRHKRGVTEELLEEEGDDPNDTIDGFYLNWTDWFEAVFVKETGHTLDEVQAVVFEADFLERDERACRGSYIRTFREALLAVDVRINALKTIFSVDADGTLERI